MKFETQVDGKTRMIEIDRDAGRFKFTIGDRSYEGDVAQPEPNVYTFYVADSVFELRVSEATGENMYRVQAGNRLMEIQVIDRKHRHAHSEIGVEGSQTLMAPMPGKVVAVLAAPGDQVERGHGILVVEAMKMQNEVKSPKDGTVKAIRVAVGDNVNAGQILAVVE